MSKFPVFAAAVTLFAAVPVAAQEWQLVKPSTTGIPGEEVRMVRFAPDDLIWVGARWPFWAEGGFGIYDRGTDLWTDLSNADGTFPSAFPNDIAWAADGSVWIGTSNGLVHRDGQNQTVYTIANAPLRHNVIGAVAIGLDGHVWVNNTTSSNNNAAIFEFDGTNWTEYRVGFELPWDPPWNSLSDLIVDRDGHVWVANTVLNGVAEYDGAEWVLHGANVGRFGEIAEDTAGNIWLRAGIGGGNSFWRFNRTSFRQYPITTTPTSIGIDDDGSVYLGDWFGNVRKSTDFGASFFIWASGLNQVYDITPDPKSNDVWIGTPGAVGHFDGNGQLLRDFNSYNTGIGDYFIDDFDLDSAGNFWVATGEAGLSRFDGLEWRNWGNHNVGSEPYPFAGNEPMGAFYLDQSGVGWMGGNGIARWIPETGEFTGFWNWQNNPSMGVTLFVEFAEDAQGRLFAASEYGSVFHFDGTRWQVEPITVYRGTSDPSMHADSNGDVWLTAWFDIWHWDGQSWQTVPLPNPNYFFDLGGINCMAIGPDDVMWLGTNEGLVRYDGSAFTLFDKSNTPLPAAQVAGVDVRDDGVIGLSSLEFGATTPFPNGVAIIDGDVSDPVNWSTWSYGNSQLPHYQLGRVKFDADGNLWVSAISEGAAVLLHPAQPLRSGRPLVSASMGGTVDFAIHAGANAGGQLYAVLGSLSGTEPGVPLPGGSVLPLNLDLFTSLSVGLPGFVGTLDGSGRADFDLTLPPIPVAVGLSMHFAHILPNAGWSVSNPVPVRFTP